MRIRLVYALVGGFAVGFGSAALPHPWNRCATVALALLVIGYAIHTWFWLRKTQKEIDELVRELDEMKKTLPR